jgi:hypothetical protein
VGLHEQQLLRRARRERASETGAIGDRPCAGGHRGWRDGHCLQANGIRRVNLVTPYVQTTNERLKQFLLACGIDVVDLATFDMLDMFDHAKIEPSDVYAKAKTLDHSKAQATFIACTQVRALEIVDLLEQDIGKPVYSVNQACAWQAFSLLGIDPGIKNRGSLLRSLSKRGPATATAKTQSARAAHTRR